MVSHYWGDNWFEQYGNKLYEAEHWLGVYFTRFTGGYLMNKEKYGTIRYEHLIHTWFHPLYIRNDFINWLYPYTYKYWEKYARWILFKLIKRAIKKFSEVKDEILDDYEWFDEYYWNKLNA